MSESHRPAGVDYVIDHSQRSTRAKRFDRRVTRALVAAFALSIIGFIALMIWGMS